RSAQIAAICLRLGEMVSSNVELHFFSITECCDEVSLAVADRGLFSCVSVGSNRDLPKTKCSGCNRPGALSNNNSPTLLAFCFTSPTNEGNGSIRPAAEE